jgi:hypothetical protein
MRQAWEEIAPVYVTPIIFNEVIKLRRELMPGQIA